MDYTCKNCGGIFNFPKGIRIVTCPYCGFTINIDTDKVDFEHYFYPIIYDDNRAYAKLKAILSRQFGVPKDFSNQMNLISRILHYIPLYLFYVECKASNGTTEVLEVDHIILPALRFSPIPIPNNYRFPVRGKIHFKPGIIKNAYFHMPSVLKDELEDIAKVKVSSRFYRELDLAGKNSKIDLISRFEGLIHYPIWEFKYSYLKYQFNGFVDAVSGEVLYGQYPISVMHRTLSTSVGIGFISAGILIGLFLGALFSTPMIGLIGSLPPAFIGALPLFMKGAYKIHTYTLKFFEEVEISEGKYGKLLKIIKSITGFRF